MANLRNGFHSCDYQNECTSLNANILHNFTPQNPPLKSINALLLNWIIIPQFEPNYHTILSRKKTIKGVLEYVGDTYIILHDLKSHIKSYISFIKSISSLSIMIFGIQNKASTWIPYLLKYSLINETKYNDPVIINKPFLLFR